MDIAERIRRVYTAVGQAIDDDLSHFPPRATGTSAARSFVWDFSGGMTPEQMANEAHAVIASIASLRDHLMRWAESHQRDPKRVVAVVQSAPAIQLLIDVWNADKHGYPLTHKTQSGKAPHLIDVARALNIRARQPGERVELLPNTGGIDVHGSPQLRVVFTGRVVDADGTPLGSLPELLEQGLAAWEALLQEWALL